MVFEDGVWDFIFRLGLCFGFLVLAFCWVCFGGFIRRVVVYLGFLILGFWELLDWIF